MRKKIRAFFEIEDQRDWQSECPRNPFSCFFCFLLELLNARTILDLTYGIGAFYEACPQLDIIAIDIIQRDWLVKPREFFRAVKAEEIARELNVKLVEEKRFTVFCERDAPSAYRADCSHNA